MAAGVSGAVIHVPEYNDDADFNQLLMERPISVSFRYYNFVIKNFIL